MLGWEVIPRIPLGNLSVSPHGVGIAVGYFIGATLLARRARKTGFDEDHAWNAAVVGILGAIVGARLAYVLGHSDQFNEPIEYLQIYKGGISLMGGLIGGFFAAWLYCRVKKLDFLRLADMGAAGLAIGTAIGRIGDLVIGDHLGRTTEGFWGWQYKGGELISSPPCDPSVYPSADGCIEPGMVVHQTALYDSLWALVIFLVILRLERKPRPKGFLVLTWAAMYSMGRILTDLVRVDKTWFGTGLTGSQLTAIAVLLLSLICLTRIRRSPKVAAVTPAEDTVVAGGDEVEAPVEAGAVPAAADAVETVPAAEAAETVAVPAAADATEPRPAAEGAEVVAAPVDSESVQAEPAAEAVEVVAEEVSVDATEPAETVVIVETVEEPPAAMGETPSVDGEPVKPAGPVEPAAEEPLVPVEPVSPVAPEAVEPEQAPPLEPVAPELTSPSEPAEEAPPSPAPETMTIEVVDQPEAGAEPVELLFTDDVPSTEPVGGGEPVDQPESGLEPVEVLFSDGESPADLDAAPEAVPAEPVEALRETVAAVDAAEAVVVEAAAPVEPSDQAGSDTLLAEEPVGAEAIDAMPLSESSEPELESPLAEDAAPSVVVVPEPPAEADAPEAPEAPDAQASPAATEPSPKEEPLPPAGPGGERQEP